MRIKRHIDFLNEGVDSINWDLVEKFIKIIRKDIQLDDTDENFCGFINIDPTDCGSFENMMPDFIKALKSDKDRLKEIMLKYRLEVQSYSDGELIIGEIKNAYVNEDPDKFLTNRGCTLKNGLWSCPGILDISSERSPLVRDEKLVVNFDYVHDFRANSARLTSMEGLPKRFNEIDLGGLNNFRLLMQKWYLANKGYDDLWIDFLKHMIAEHPKQIDSIDWPEGFLNDNLKKSVKAVSKFDL